MNARVVLCTCSNDKEATRIARSIVRERLAACVNRLPVRSTFEWKAQLDDIREVLLIIKTTRAQLARLSERIRKLHSYSVPEIIELPVVGGAAAYLSWVETQCRSTSKSARRSSGSSGSRSSRS